VLVYIIVLNRQQGTLLRGTLLLSIGRKASCFNCFAVEFTLALAAGAIGEDEYATWLQKWSVKDD
jgi:hypothetical protein